MARSSPQRVLWDQVGREGPAYLPTAPARHPEEKLPMACELVNLVAAVET